MKTIKQISQKLIVYLVIFETILSCVIPVQVSAYTKEECGNAVAGFAQHIVDDIGDSKITYDYGTKRTHNPLWEPESYTWDSDMWMDCSSFAVGCWHYVAGLEIYHHWTGPLTDPTPPSDMSVYFHRYYWQDEGFSRASDLQPGDLLAYNPGGETKKTQRHAFLFVSMDKGFANDGTFWHSNVSGYLRDAYNAGNAKGRGNKGFVLYRMTDEGAALVTSLNTEFSLGGASGSGKTINYSKFYFNGIPDGKYSLASRKSIFELVVSAMKELVNFFTGLISYLFRGFIIGIISVFDRLINNTVQSINDSPKTLKETGIKATDADVPEKEDRSVTIEGLVFDGIDLFDINIFQTN